MSVTLRINIGSGPNHIPGYVDWDIVDGANAFPLPFASGTVDAIRASHVLEHLLFAETEQAIAEWNRVLKIGGEVKIAVPDFDKAAADSSNLRLRYVMGGQTNEHDVHKAAFTRDSLAELLTRHGFEVTGDWESEIKDCASLPVSLNLAATKKRNKLPKICVITNVPRLGFQLHFGCMHRTFGALGIPIRTSTGVYWAQCQTRGLEAAIADGFEWAICVDYDSVFTEWHVRALIDTMMMHPEVHALAPLQPQRHSDLIMVSVKDRAEEVTMGTTVPTQVNTAHFGLTVLRLDAFAKLAKPWFIDQPDPDGGYEDGRIDADVNFWHRWNEAGLNVSVLAGVSIGHLEGKVTHFNVSENKIECDYVGDYLKKHTAWGVPECITT